MAKGVRDVLLMFKQLNVSNTGALTLSEFCNVYDTVAINWEVQYAHIPWFHSAWMPLQRFCQLMHNVVVWTHFETVVCKCFDICRDWLIPVFKTKLYPSAMFD